jgi:diphthamide biosynthesis protein 3
LKQDDLRDGEDIARCPSCSLMLRVIYDPDDFADEDEEETTYEIDQSIVVS